MTIGHTRFFVDKHYGWAIRSVNRKTDQQPFEFHIYKRRPKLRPDFNFRETTDCDGMEYSLCIRWLWFALHILLWSRPGKPEGRHMWDERDRMFGWYFLDTTWVVGWWFGKPRHIDIPFYATKLVSSHILSFDRARIVETEIRGKFLECWDKREALKAEHSKTFDYHYRLKSGEVQKVKATVHVGRFVRRKKWWFVKTNEDWIDVKFDQEVGEERGSWKGGCVGCGYTLRPGETAEACLRRMEKERRFERNRS